MRQILLVEDSTMFGRLVKAKIEKALGTTVHWLQTYKEADRILQKESEKFSLALLDFNLPDAPNGEIIDRVLSHGITSFVFTAGVSDEVREIVWSKKVADYIIKDDPNSLRSIIASIQQLERNRSTLVLVAGESSTQRTMISELLYVRQFRVVNASGGRAALEILARHPEVSLIITDYSLSDMNGCDLCRKIREQKPQEKLSIIGTFVGDDKSVGARFIKSGADDCIDSNSFLVEEFYSRINRCLATLDLITRVRESSRHDYLTGVLNRSFFFSEGADLIEKMNKKGENMACAIVHIDDIREINAAHGNDIGDRVLTSSCRAMSKHIGPEDIIARLAGTEFALLTATANKNDAVQRFAELRIQIEQTPMCILQGKPISVTCSIGLCLAIDKNLEKMVKTATQNLLRAQGDGANRVIY